MFYVCSGLMLVGAIYFLWVFRGTGLLIGGAASGVLLSTEVASADSTSDETLSEHEDATECMTEDGSLSEGSVSDAKKTDSEESSSDSHHDEEEDKPSA